MVTSRAPFVVAKTETPCDTTLLGFVADPFGVEPTATRRTNAICRSRSMATFPAKVTMESGPIRRGDPITSSSTPGHGMKAVQACRIIGYALEDADRDGTIQIFAHLGEHAAPEVQALRAELGEVRAELQQLRARWRASRGYGAWGPRRRGACRRRG